LVHLDICQICHDCHVKQSTPGVLYSRTTRDIDDIWKDKSEIYADSLIVMELIVSSGKYYGYGLFQKAKFGL
jgi:hypothetical protein